MALGNTLQTRAKFVPPTLEITSMMDMFTIIVFFLLFAYGEKPQEITMEEDIDLPASSSEIDYKNTVKIFLTGEKILIEKDVIANIVNDKIQNFDQDNPEKSQLYAQIKLHKEKQVAELKKSRELSKGMSVEGSEVSSETMSDSEDGSDEFSVLLFCDRQIPFELMKKLMKVTGMAGYPNFQLAVLEK